MLVKSDVFSLNLTKSICHKTNQIKESTLLERLDTQESPKGVTDHSQPLNVASYLRTPLLSESSAI